MLHPNHDQIILNYTCNDLVKFMIITAPCNFPSPVKNFSFVNIS